MKKKYLYSLAKINTTKIRFLIIVKINYDIYEKMYNIYGMSIHMAFIEFLFFNFDFGFG